MTRDDVILSVLEKIETAPSIHAGREASRWLNCWRDMADELGSQPYDPALLIPPFLLGHDVARFGGDWQEVDKDFVVIHDALVRGSVFSTFLKDCPRIVELGCGTGRNINMLNGMFPETELVASDYTYYSRDILQFISLGVGKQFPWVYFNMRTLEGWEDLKINGRTTLLTVHAMEQLGTRYHNLFDVICLAKPFKVVNLEPLDDLYDQSKLYDKLAFMYHRARGYLCGWVEFLKQQERAGKVIILQEPVRYGLGDRYHEAYSLVVWKPL